MSSKDLVSMVGGVRRTLAGVLALGAALALSGCGQAPEPQSSGDRTQEGGGWYANGGGWYANGGGWYANGGGWYANGGSIFFDAGGGIPNGGGANANGAPASQAQGLGVDSNYGSATRKYRPIGWDPDTGKWVGSAWGGWTNPVDCAATGSATGMLSNGSDQACTTLHNAINHTDVDGDNNAGSKQDKNMRLVALGHWVGCACPSNVSIPFKDTHGDFPEIRFNGGMGFAPTWCGKATTTVDPKTNQVVPLYVSTLEIQRVSGCMLALQNTSWKHYNLSLRSNAGTSPTSPNETLLAVNNAARYWGNLWKDPHTDTDTTTCDPATDPSCTNAFTQGGAWYNKERFSCQVFAGGGVQNYGLQDQWVYGRECEVSRCGGGVEHLGLCMSNVKRLANASDPAEYAHVVGGQTYYEAADVSLFNFPPAAAGGLSLSYANDAYGVSSLASATYRGDTTAAIDVWTPSSISLEDPLPNPLPNSSSLGAGQPNPWWYGTGWVQHDFGTLPVPSWQSGDCTGGYQECQGNSQLSAYRKLFGLNSDQWLTINYTGYRPQSGLANLAGESSAPVTMAIRYQRAGQLGHGQCDPVVGCGGTQPSDCSSGVVGATGACSGGTGSTGKLDVYVMGNVASSTSWTQVHGSGMTKNMFPATGVRGGYNTAYVYPIYPQNSYSTISGIPSQWSRPSSYTAADTLRVAIHGTTSSTGDAPHLDTAYFSPGMPLPDMDCTTSAGCFLYAGPNQFLSLGAGSEKSINLGAGFNVSPTLPPGKYTFQLKNVYGDLDLRVKANGLVSASVYDCASVKGRNAEESCTITLDAPGYVSVMVTGYANQICNSTAPTGCTCAGNVSGCAATGTVIGHNGNSTLINGGLIVL